ncbi:AraC family transcriptional regulator [uncultured Kocuria sp.]|uniref:AraC family transcriptional regulator n=1 Tax=uncultured Kocuria sp. TaxID=259305 RepID=UPI002622470F|nr:AraC family transcriptional regulator [uncultured Kocuria sp.]
MTTSGSSGPGEDSRPGAGPLRRTSFATRDPDRGIAAMSELYTGLGMRAPTDGSFELRMATASVGPLLAHRFLLATSESSGTGDVSGTYSVVHVLTGRLTVSSGKERITTPLPFLLPQGLYGGRWDGLLELSTVVLDAHSVEALACDLLGAPEFALRFTGSAPVSPGMTRYWLSQVRHFHQDLLPNTEALSTPLVRAEASRAMATALLHCFPNTFLAQPAPSGGAPALPAQLRRAIAFVDENLHEDIGLAEIAAAARMSPRGLQAAFRRELGRTPVGHLREARLDAARRDLLRVDPAAGETVAAVAARWGFAHPGRFATAYRVRFGEAPGATLHR